MKAILFLLIVMLFVFSGCLTQHTGQNDSNDYLTESRHSKIPLNAIKVTSETDLNPPVSLSSEYYNPVPLAYPVNTAGAEDSAFILPEGDTLYFWFTPDVKAPPEKQITDGVTGIYISYKLENGWTEPERVWLNNPGKLSLDGCGFVRNSEIWFCSAREGYVHSGYGSGLNWFTAEFNDLSYKWADWKVVDFPEGYEVGELHIHGDEIYYHSSKSGGKGGLDIWVIEKNSDGTWSEPKNLENINTERDEGFPALSPDGDELWISRDYALWRSKKVNSEWTEPEKMFSPLAGEASIDSRGNVYFTHHFFEGDEMIEADIYVSYKK